MGALTSKSFEFKFRPWELESIYNYWFYDSLNLPIQMDLINDKLARILPRTISSLNISFLYDEIRFFDPIKTIKKIIFPFLKNKNNFIRTTWLYIFNFIYNILLTKNIKNINLKLFEIISNNFDLIDFFVLKKNKMYLNNIKQIILNTNKIPHQIYNYYFFSYFNNKISTDYYMSKTDLKNKFNFIFFNFNPRIESPILNLYLKKLQYIYKIKFHYFNYFLLNNDKDYNYNIGKKGFIKFEKGQSVLNILINLKDKINILFLNENLYFKNYNNLQHNIINNIYISNNFYIYIKLFKIIKNINNFFFSKLIKVTKNLEIFNIFNFSERLLNNIKLLNTSFTKNTIVLNNLISGVYNHKWISYCDFLIPNSFFLERRMLNVSLLNDIIFTKKIFTQLITALNIHDFFYFFVNKKIKKSLFLKQIVNKFFYICALFTKKRNKIQKHNLKQRLLPIINLKKNCQIDEEFNPFFFKFMKNELFVNYKNFEIKAKKGCIL